jgi:hypothetical protein
LNGEASWAKVPMMRLLRLSFIVPADSFATIVDVAERLSAQSVAEEIELVVVCPAASQLGDYDQLGPVRITVVEHPLLPLGEARAAGVRAAAATVVAIGETHTYPAPGWGEHLLAAHEGPWAAVVPAITNANPEGGAASWSTFLIDYGRWAFGEEAREIDDPPSYNASFKKAHLLELGDDLGRLLEPGDELPHELRKRGHRSYYEPRARIEHLNLTRRGAWHYERFLGGRLLGSARRAHWPMARTLLYVAGSPLIPVISLARTRHALAAAGRNGGLPAHTGTAVVLACVLFGIGELVGYVAGEGRAEADMLEYELHKVRYI